MCALYYRYVGVRLQQYMGATYFFNVYDHYLIQNDKKWIFTEFLMRK